jgi:GTP-binding protein LepA
VLDDMDLERERGITIKAHPVTMRYQARDGQVYQFNLIDTPGHVDFSYEVSRSLSACEGAILIVDATQGVEAQTVAHTYLAMEQEVVLVPVINKIDLPNANVDAAVKQIEDVLAIPVHRPLLVSAKTGQGVEEVLETLVREIPPPKTQPDKGTRALVFDSEYDTFRGVVVYLRVMDGELAAGDRIRLMGTGRDYDVKEVGVFAPKPTPVAQLGTGCVGYLIGNIKVASEVRIGDTMTMAGHPASESLPGFRAFHPMVFTGLYPVDADDYDRLKGGMEKLALNDSAFVYQAETSAALGFGFRCGFLGLLHMEIVQERLRREYGLNIIATYPGVIYRVFLNGGERIEIDNPMRLPDPTQIHHIEEPTVSAFVICQNECIGDILQLVMDRRGEVQKTESLDTRRVMLTCRLPLNEILIDFHDKLKSISRGYASMDYEHAGYQESELVKLDILVHGEVVEAFSSIIHRSKAYGRGRQICLTLKDMIPPQMFPVAVQAAINRKIIARETIRAFRKDVTAKCYGGDVTRKRKLLERQKEGKRKMKQVGRVSIPQEAFVSVLKAKE